MTKNDIINWWKFRKFLETSTLTTKWTNKVGRRSSKKKKKKKKKKKIKKKKKKKKKIKKKKIKKKKKKFMFIKNFIYN